MTFVSFHLDVLLKFQEMIESGEIPKYKIFTHEPAKKRQRRKAKENHEEEEADDWRKQLGLDNGM